MKKRAMKNRRGIAESPQASRRALSRQLCAVWQWQQSIGTPRDMICRGLMLGLHREDLIDLPALRRHPPNPFARRVGPAPLAVDCTPVRCNLEELGARLRAGTSHRQGGALQRAA